ncbi:hypothetical protein [Leucobacter tenebrionis]|uniref:hypothetical protein n=1 Tax=Leucobacter tenebrionis TaxID=2873270 RepID=UPI001CA7A572|nr:hypothetical protein [Leucobacter tenebrionis]QZY51511.1 hypothetical protein KVY00_13230 [Leucobacter tenebrionis]
MADATYAGPVSFTVFTLPAPPDLAGITAELTRLAADRRAEILDVELVGRAEDGSVQRFELSEGLAPAETGLLDEGDLETVARELPDGRLAFVVVYEDRLLAGLAAQVAAVGGTELWVGGVDPDDLDEQHQESAP